MALRLQTVNVSGTKFQLHEELWVKMKKKLPSQYNEKVYFLNEEVFVARDSRAFQAILYSMLGNELHIPSDMCPSVFRQELNFWGIDETDLAKCCFVKYMAYFEDQEALKILEDDEQRKIGERLNLENMSYHKGWHGIKGKMWLILNEPYHSNLSRAYFMLHVLLITVSIFALVAGTHQSFQRALTINEWKIYFGDDWYKYQHYFFDATSPEPEVELSSDLEVESMSEPESESTSESEVEFSSEPEVESTSEHEVESASEPEVESSLEPKVESASEQEVESTFEPEVQSTPEPEAETTSEPEVESASEPEVESSLEPEVESASEPEVDTTSEPEVESTSEPEVETASVPEVESASEPEFETTSEPEVKSTSGPEVETVSVPEVESASEPKFETTSEPEVESASELEVESTSYPKTEPSPEPEVESAPEQEFQSTSDLDANSGADTVVTVQTTPATDSQSIAESVKRQCEEEAQSEGASETVPLPENARARFTFLDIIEYISIAFFTLDLLVRVVVCPYRLKLLYSFLHWVDVFALSVMYAKYIVEALYPKEKYEASVLDILHCLQVVRILQMFRLVENSIAFRVLLFAFKASFTELLHMSLFLFVAMLLFSTCIYFSGDTNFPNIPDAFWWSLITMTTVGYGDMVPKEPLSRFVGVICSITGVCIIAVIIPIFVNNFVLFYSYSKVWTTTPDRKTRRKKAKLTQVTAIDA